MSTLAKFPYVTIRFGCTKCQRRGQYRLARLAAKLGPEIGMGAVLAFGKRRARAVQAA